MQGIEMVRIVPPHVEVMATIQLSFMESVVAAPTFRLNLEFPDFLRETISYTIPPLLINLENLHLPTVDSPIPAASDEALFRIKPLVLQQARFAAFPPQVESHEESILRQSRIHSRLEELLRAPQPRWTDFNFWSATTTTAPPARPYTRADAPRP